MPGLCALAVLLLATASPALSAGLFAPDLNWRTLNTPHFSIHYHDGLSATALQVAELAESVHSRQSARLNWTPKNRTHMVLNDLTDQANGFAIPFPSNTMVLNLTAPDGDTHTLLNQRDWLYTLLLHEYTHILHLDQARGAPRILRTLFGRFPLFFPNLFNPPWMIEGLATLEETRGTGGGRGRGALKAGLLRTQAAEGRLRPLDAASHPVSTWPGGSMPYLYGVSFLEDVARRYGDDIPTRLAETYSRNLVPFLVSDNFRSGVGQPLSGAWNDWQTGLMIEASAASARLKPPAIPERLTFSGYYTGGARVAPDGRIAFTGRTPHDHDRILLLGETNAPPGELAWRNGGRGLSWSADGRSLLFSQPEYADSYRLYDDLYRLDTDTAKVRRLTHGARLREPDVAPDGQIVAVHNGSPAPGATTLVLLNEAGAGFKMTPLLESGPDAVFSHPRFSPDGRQVAVSVSRSGGRRDIARVDTESGVVTFVTDDDAQDADPAWSPDGGYLLFASDRTGTFNLFAHHIASGELSQVTDVLGAALTPEVTPDGTAILFSGLSADGFDLYRVPLNPATWRPAPAPPTPVAAPERATAETVARPAEPYHPYPAALPRYWLPVSYVEDDNSYLGVFTSGSDPIGRHTYLFQAAFSRNDQLTEATLVYLYDRFHPTLQLILDRDYIGELTDGFGNLAAHHGKHEADLDLIFPLRRVNRLMTLSVGVGVEDEFATRVCSACTVLGLRTDRFLRLGLSYDSTQDYALGVSPTDGRHVTLTSESASDAWNSDLEGHAVVLDWEEFRPLPWRAQVIRLRIAGARADGDLLFTAGGTPNLIENAFERDFAVRGFADRSFIGDNLLLGTLSWRFPLALPERGHGTLPLFLEKLHGNLFVDTIRTRNNPGDWKHGTGYGAELGTDVVAGYFLPLTFRFGVANGTGSRGETQTYLVVEAPI